MIYFLLLLVFSFSYSSNFKLTSAKKPPTFRSDNEIVNHLELCERIDDYACMTILIKRKISSRLCQEEEFMRLFEKTSRHSTDILRNQIRILKQLQLNSDEYLIEFLDFKQRRLSSESLNVIQLIEKHCLNDQIIGITNLSNRAFYYRLVAKFLLYRFEADHDIVLLAKAEDTFRLAMKKCHLVRDSDVNKLKLKIDYSMFQYNYKSDIASALEIAEKAFKEAMGDLSSVEGKSKLSYDLILRLETLIETWRPAAGIIRNN